METVFESLRQSRVIPVVSMPDAEAAEGLGRALVAGGLSTVEVTFRSAAAVPSIERLRSVEGLVVGAGTVRTVEQLEQARSAGAQFVVSPGLVEDVVRRAVELGIPVSPGVVTPGEVERALALGARVLKFFPAQSFGGVQTLKALGAVFPEVPFIPTGGVNAANLVDYLALDNVLACGGSWLATPKLLSERRFDEVERLSQEASRLAHGLA